MHGEFLRLLFIIAHPAMMNRRTVRWFKDMGDDYHSEDAFKFRRGQLAHSRRHWPRCSRCGRSEGAGRRAPCVAPAPPPTRDALLFPATIPSGI
jgi:hypothetical protein